MFKNKCFKVKRFLISKNKKIICFLISLGIFSSVVVIGSIFLFQHKNNEIQTIQYKKDNLNSLTNIEVDVPSDEAIVMTDAEPKTSFHITNYRELINVVVKTDKPDLIKIIDNKNGTINLEVLNRGAGFIHINADNAIDEYTIKFSNGLLKASDVLYKSYHCLITKRGVMYLDETDDSNTKIDMVLKTTWFSPKPSDIIKTSQYIVATKYGILNTWDCKFILKDIYPTISTNDIIGLSSEIIVTKKGIFNYKGEQIAKTQYPVVGNDDIIELLEKVVVTKKGVFNVDSKDTPIMSLSDKGILGSAFNYANNYILTNAGIYDENGTLIAAARDITEQFSSSLSPEDIIGFSENFIATRSGVYNFNKKIHLNNIDPKSIVLVANQMVITRDGFYTNKSNKKETLDWFENGITKDNIIYSGEYGIYTNKGILDCYNVSDSFKYNLNKDDIYEINQWDPWSGETAIIRNLGVHSFSGVINRMVLFKDEKWKLFKNEILETHSTHIITSDSIYYWGGSKNILKTTNYLDNEWYLAPDTNHDSSDIVGNKNYTNIIIGSTVGIILALLAIGLGVVIPIHKNRKKMEKNFNRFYISMNNMFKQLTEAKVKKPLMLTTSKPIKPNASPIMQKNDLNYSKINPPKKPTPFKSIK